MEDVASAVIAAAAARGWDRAAARRRLAELGWDALLPQLAGGIAPAAIAADLDRHTRCQVCGHPLHPTVGDVRLRLPAGEVLILGLPHTAACSCGYAMPQIPLVWMALAERRVGDRLPEGPLAAADLRARR